MLPPESEAAHFNFPYFFGYQQVQSHLIRLQETLDDVEFEGDIVLNFEKCQWFDIFPLAQLLTILFSRVDRKPILHVVGPCVDVLPYIFASIARWRRQLNSEDLEERNNAQQKLDRSENLYPQLRRRAGSFLLGWGVFDLIEDNYEPIHWYMSRNKVVSLGELREIYQFAYGVSAPVTAVTSDRVWPFSVVHENEQAEMIERVNGEELLASALMKRATDVIADGTASNVFFYEPFENVFRHAFPDGYEHKLTLVAMRINHWMYQGNEVTPKGKWVMSQLPTWESKYIESLGGKSFMEITINDSGLGIPVTINTSMLRDGQYCKEHNISAEPFHEDASLAWKSIKFAFESYSTRRTEIAPGIRGLAWLKEKMLKARGLIQVVSNGGNYVLADYGEGLIEASFPESQENATNQFLHGTYIRMLFPLEDTLRRTPDRRPRWDRIRYTSTPLTKVRDDELGVFLVPSELTNEPAIDDWSRFFEQVSSSLSASPEKLAALDFDRQQVSRWAMENLFKALLGSPNLHGKIIAVNCNRHVTCRLDTISSISDFKDANLVLPIFETNLRMYWAGLNLEAEGKLLRAFQRGFSRPSQEILSCANGNRGYFVWENASPRDFSFGIEEVESVVRHRLGDKLWENLEERGAIHRGRYVMPLSNLTVSTYVEPHQVFAEGGIASLLCDHLAALLRWRYGRVLGKNLKNMKVLTATRIGRDIATRMPEAYPQKYFVYFDYHLLQPTKPRLLKHLSGNSVVIVVDIISTGAQVEELIRICSDANCEILGILSFIDFSPEISIHARQFQSVNGALIEHKTFKRSPQTISRPRKGDTQVNKESFSVSPAVEIEAESGQQKSAILSRERGLRLLEDAEAIHYGHYELFGRHAEFVTNFGRLITSHSPQREEIIRSVEQAILTGSRKGSPTAIVLYPDFSNIHILQAPIERRNKIRALTRGQDKLLQFVEARRGSRSRGRRYWLTQSEVKKLKEWAQTVYPNGYSVLLLDDGASSGETLLALLDLARELEPREVSAFVIVNRMPHLRTHHHTEIEKFAWATSSFHCLLHLNAQVYARENCPMCHERTELLRELRQAKDEWFKAQLENRLQKLEPITALHPQDLPEGLFAQQVHDVPPFSWDNQRILPGDQQSVISRALSVRTAINDGLQLIDVLKEVSDQANDHIWHLSAIEIGRRVDLHLSQRCEADIRDAFIEVLAGRNLQRRISALEALRYMRPESLLPAMRHIVHAALDILYGDEIVGELLLLIRRVFSYRHLITPLAFEEEQAVAQELDRASAHVRPMTPVRESIERINYEWGKGPQPQLNLTTTISSLEKIFKTQRALGHRLLYVLAEYISDYREDIDRTVTSAIDDVVRAAYLARILFSSLEEIGMLRDRVDLSAADQALTEARSLRMWVEAHMWSTERRKPRELMQKLEDLKDLCGTIEKVLKTQLVKPAEASENAVQAFKTNLPEALRESKIQLDFFNLADKDDVIIVDQALYRDIIRNLLQNLRHAIDPANKTVKAELRVFRATENHASQIQLQIDCMTKGEQFGTIRSGENTTEVLRQNAEPYGVEWTHSSNEAAVWSETWSFWRL